MTFFIFTIHYTHFHFRFSYRRTHLPKRVFLNLESAS